MWPDLVSKCGSCGLNPSSSTCKPASCTTRASKYGFMGQPLEILTMLLERRGEVVRREEFRARLWPVDTFVDFEHSLNAAVNKLREALGDSAEEPSYIETVPRRGYRFIASVDADALN